MSNDFWIGRHLAAMIPPFMLPRRGPATEGERAALRLPGRPRPPRRDSGEPDTRSAPAR